jgi:predicted DNA-binding ribbon-helix-helix protein
MPRPKQPRLKPGEGMVGIRMPEAVVADLKSEARRRKMSVGKLVQELWTAYRERAAKPKQ